MRSFALTYTHPTIHSFRFTGPATTVKGSRTMGEAISDTGRLFSQMMLHPSQIQVLYDSLKLVFLTGPPGTGKSLVLIVKALTLLRQGKHVLVVSTWKDSLAVSYNICDQLRQTAEPSATSLIHHHEFDLSDGGDKVVETAVKTLTSSDHSQELNVIVDEPYLGGLVVFSLTCAPTEFNALVSGSYA